MCRLDLTVSHVHIHTQFWVGSYTLCHVIAEVDGVGEKMLTSTPYFILPHRCLLMFDLVILLVYHEQ